MEAVIGKGVQVRAKFKGNDFTGTYKYGENYLLSVIKDPAGNVLVALATGKGKRSYTTLENYQKDWDELEITENPKDKDAPHYSLTITYHENGSPNLNHTNSGMKEADVVTSLHIALLQILQSITGGGKKS